MSTATGIVAPLRDALATRRGERLRRRRLERELAGFVTPAERLELEALLDRHSREETREVRAILARQALSPRATTPGLGGRRAA